MRLFRATVADVPRIERCARDCCAEHGAVLGELNWPFYQTRWERLLQTGLGAMFLYEGMAGEIVGGIGMGKYEDMLTGKWRAAQVFVYVRPEVRGAILFRRMMNVAEAWAMEELCDDVVMPLLPSMPEGTEAFYRHGNYELLQSNYRKRFYEP